KALEIRDETRYALRLERARPALLGDRVAFGREPAELHRRVAYRDQQRQRDEREADERQPEQRSWSPEPHRPNLTAQASLWSIRHVSRCSAVQLAQTPAASLRSQRSELETMRSRSSKRGAQPSVERILEAS